MNPRVALVLTMAVFIISPVLAWLIHAGVIDVGLSTAAGKNHGELVHPARPLAGFDLIDDKGRPIDRENFLGKWSLLEVADDPCVEDCMKNIYKMRQIRLAIGKDAYRIQRVVIAAKDTDMQKIMSDNPGTLLYRIVEKTQRMLAQFPGYVEGDISTIAGRIYIIDPLGNLMMRYPGNADPSDILEDMRHLLKATWIRPTDRS